MRSYFIKVPPWARSVYPSAIWKRDDRYDPEGHLHLTIDDGPHPDSTPLWLDLLDELNKKATFFLLGKEAKKYPHLLAEIKTRGHQVGSHGMYHADGWKTKTDIYVDQASASLDFLQCYMFRPPYGHITFSQLRRLKPLCDVIMWSLMPGDFDDSVTAEQGIRRMAQRRSEDIIVFHDHPDAFARAKQCLSAHYE